MISDTGRSRVSDDAGFSDYPCHCWHGSFGLLRNFENIVPLWALTCMAAALAYFITFTCYGARLHGGEHGSVGRGHRLFGTPLIAPCRPFEAEMEDLMAAEAMVLTSAERQTVLASIRGTCGHFEWRLMAAQERKSVV